MNKIDYIGSQRIELTKISYFMKRILTAATLALAMLAMASCQGPKDQPAKMYEKVKEAAALAGDGKIEQSDSIWTEIQAWSKTASEADRLEFHRLALGEPEVVKD